MLQPSSLHPTTINALLETFDVPGLAVAVVQNDAIVAAQGYGVQTLGATTPVDEDTLFATGSLSKSVTATALALLIDKQLLDWDGRVTQFLPSFQMSDPYVTRESTVRDLLTHRCGLAPISGGTIWYGSTYSRADVLYRMRYLKPESSFRSRFAYQNITYLAAGQIVEAVTGHSWDQFVRKQIFAPLGMARSTTCMCELEQRDNVATPHAAVGSAVQPICHRSHDNVGPAASVYASARDIAQYMRLYLHAGRLGGQQFVSSSAMHELVAPQMIVPIKPWTPPIDAFRPTFLTYGLGWFVRDYRGQKMIYHAGGVDGMRAWLGMLPGQSLGVAVLSNQEEPLAAALMYTLLDAFCGAPQSDWCSAYLQARDERRAQARSHAQKVNTARVSGTTLSLGLEQYAGRYHDSLYGDASISLENEHLILRFSHTPSFTGDLEHWHYDTFRITWRDPLVPSGFVTFPLTSQGKTYELKLDQPHLLDVDFREVNFARSL